jgi:hypothetical protein
MRFRERDRESERVRYEFERKRTIGRRPEKENQGEKDPETDQRPNLLWVDAGEARCGFR